MWINHWEGDGGGFNKEQTGAGGDQADLVHITEVYVILLYSHLHES